MWNQVRAAVLAAGVIAAVAACVPAQAASATVTPAQVQAGYNAAISADVAASTRLPSGSDLWVTGDVTRVGTHDVQGAYGYPHGAFMETAPGSATFKVLAGRYGPDYWNGVPTPGHQYQQVPNWPDGDFFWMQVPLVDHGTLNVIGERVHPTGTCGLCFAIAGTYDATFSATTLAYEGSHPVPDGTTGDVWTGGTGDGAGGWWLTSQHGELAHVPAGKLATAPAWAVHPWMPMPALLGSWLVRTPRGWDLFGEQWEGTKIQRWQASTPAGPWAGPVTVGTTPPDTDGGIAAHPELGAPAGEVVISWLVNTPGFYGPKFGYART